MRKKDLIYVDLIAACREPGCPLCRISRAYLDHHLDSVMYEYVLDLQARAELREARGYCQEHAWMLSETYGRALGTAIIHQDVIETLLQAMEDAPQRGRARRRARQLHRALAPETECPACAYQRTMDENAMRALLQHLHNPQIAEAVGASQGFCLPHFSRLLALEPSEEALETLVALQRRVLSEMRDELAEFIRKNDYRFQDEPFGEESDSWIRSIGLLTGDRPD
jgi:hypothetical protein